MYRNRGKLNEKIKLLFAAKNPKNNMFGDTPFFLGHVTVKSLDSFFPCHFFVWGGVWDGYD